jgi:hypothetical protein
VVGIGGKKVAQRRETLMGSLGLASNALTKNEFGCEAKCDNVPCSAHHLVLVREAVHAGRSPAVRFLRRSNTTIFGFDNFLDFTSRLQQSAHS